MFSDEQGCLRMTSLCCDPLVRAIVCGMNRCSFHSGKILNDQMSLLVEACRLASITRWAGQHHIVFWKQGIDKVLLDLLLEDFQIKPSQHLSSLEEQISLVQEGLGANFLLTLRPYVWDILGWLATHCHDDFNHENELHINMLIMCACVAFVDAIRKGRQICENDVIHASRSESASKAVLMMIYSPSKYIASTARFILSQILKPNGKEYLKHLLHFLNYTTSGFNIGLPYIFQTIINLVGLTCYLGLPQYQRYVSGSEVMKTLLAFVRWCWSNPLPIKRQSVAPHLYNKFSERTCCWINREWEGEDVCLLYGLWAVAELVHHFYSVSSDKLNNMEAQLFSLLQEICISTTADGPRWFAAYILSHFGFYGFLSKIGKRIGKALYMEEFADVQLILATGKALSVHGVVLAIRCPPLLPPGNEKTSNNSSMGDDTEKLSGNFRKTVRFSTHVDGQALQTLLDFVYFGYLEGEEELVKRLKPLAKSCNLQPLSLLLYRKRPNWGTSIPNCDLALGLGPVGHQFSDIILEAKASELSWTCSVCSLSVPHKHVHKVILWSSCDYLRALLESGMQESYSQTVKVPVSWEGMIKLVEWIYTDQLPNPPSGCLWDNMDNEQKLHELHPYIELCWLADIWLLEDIQDACFKVVVSCLDSARDLSIKVLQLAAKFSLWKLADFAAACMAPLYCNLRDSGDLEDLDEFLVDMVRAASVRHSQGGG